MNELRQVIEKAAQQDFPTTHSDRFDRIIDRITAAVAEYYKGKK